MCRFFVVGLLKIKKGNKMKEKELANWIYYEEANNFYCFECVQNRVNEINANKEFSSEIDYNSGDECGYMQDYAYVKEEVNCCKCGKSLLSEIDF